MVRLQRKTQDIFKVSESVVAPKAHLVSEKSQEQSIGQGLGHN